MLAGTLPLPSARPPSANRGDPLCDVVSLFASRRSGVLKRFYCVQECVVEAVMLESKQSIDEDQAVAERVGVSFQQLRLRTFEGFGDHPRSSEASRTR